MKVTNLWNHSINMETKLNKQTKQTNHMDTEKIDHTFLKLKLQDVINYYEKINTYTMGCDLPNNRRLFKKCSKMAFPDSDDEVFDILKSPVTFYVYYVESSRGYIVNKKTFWNTSGKVRFIKKYKDNHMFKIIGDVNFLAESDNELFEKDNRKILTQISKYHLFYTTNNSVIDVSRSTFTKVKGKIIVRQGHKYKLLGLCDKREAKQSKQILFKAESLKSVFKGLSTIIKGLAVIGTVESIATTVSLDRIKSMLLDFLSTALSINGLMNSFNISNVLSLLLNLYKFCDQFNKEGIFEAEGLDALAFAAASFLLPKPVYEIFKRINTFSGVKLLDDPSMFYDFFLTVIEYVKATLDYMSSQAPSLSGFLIPVRDLLDSLCSKVIYFKFIQLTLMCDKITNKPRLASDTSFRVKFYSLRDEIAADHKFVEWSKRSNVLAEGRAKISRVSKILASYENAMRIEPSCFVIEGKPGIFKSVFLNGVIAGLKTSVYSHSIKSVEDGKDWYDSYNNEELFIMDDVGSQDPSQWRNLITMVSPVKLPLDCAEAQLKDTKFFTSEKILITTNSFIKISGLTKADCIGNVLALWRRANVFDFDVTRTGNMLTGEITLKNVKPTTSQRTVELDGTVFVPGFTADVTTYMKENGLNIPYKLKIEPCEKQHIQIIAWMCDVIELVSKVKKLQYRDNDFSTRVDEIDKYRMFKRDEEDYLDSNTAFDGEGLKENYTESFYNSLDNLLEVMSEEDDEEDSILYDIIETDVPELSPLWDNVNTLDSNNCDMSTSFNEYKHGVLDKWSVVKHYFKSVVDSVILTAKQFLMKKRDCHHILFCIFLISICFLISFIGKYFIAEYCKKKKLPTSTVWYGQGGLHPSLTCLSKHVHMMDFTLDDQLISSSYGLVSGHCIISTSHGCPQDVMYVTIYKDSSGSNVLFDHAKYQVVYRDTVLDLVVLKTTVSMGSPFKNMSKYFKPAVVDLNKEVYFISDQVYPMKTIATDRVYSAVYRFKYKDFVPFEGQIEETDIFYNVRGAGRCGSIVFDINNGILGMHVAGSANESVGVSRRWDERTKVIIKDILEQDNRFILDIDISDKVLENVSGIKLDQKMFLSSPKCTNIEPTELYGVFPCTRFPSDLSKYGKHTVKDVAKKSFCRLESVNSNELSFAKQVISCIIEDFSDISNKEVISGNDYLAGLNKNSSNGYQCLKNKSDYIDFENEQFKPFFQDELDELIVNITNGHIDIKDIVWVESLKDEIRDVAKQGVPRSFRMSRVHIQVLTKLIFGEMVSNIIKTRSFHGICVGINPFSDWDKVYDSMLQCGERVWANDIAKFDGGMLAQVQTMVNEVIVDKYKGKYIEVAKFLLASLIYCIVGMNDDLMMTNHSMPSGTFLTSIGNSLINKSYTAMWYYRFSKKKSVSGFFGDIVDYVYGDDKLTGCTIKDETLNALTMTEFFRSIGLDCTTSDKKLVTRMYDGLDQVTFLKRSFRFHPKLGKIVAPLDLKTIYSGLSWYDSTKDYDSVLKDKIHNFQREMFLHPHLYSEALQILQVACKERSIMWEQLPLSYLHFLYNNEPEYCKLAQVSGSKYM